MPIARRTGPSNRVLLRNSKVYAASLGSGSMNGLFAYRDLVAGEILCRYSGPVLTQKEADKSSSEYLFTVEYRSRADGNRTIRKVVDGEGSLMGYANHAPHSIANCETKDIIGTIIERGIRYSERHAVVLVAKAAISRGTELRYHYNGDGAGDDSWMVRMMMEKHGLTLEQVNNKAWRSTRWITPSVHERVEPDFAVRSLSDLLKHTYDIPNHPDMGLERSPPRPRVARKSTRPTRDEMLQHTAMQLLATAPHDIPFTQPLLHVGEHVLRAKTSKADGTVGVKIDNGPWVTRGHTSLESAWRRVAHMAENDVYDVVDAMEEGS